MPNEAFDRDNVRAWLEDALHVSIGYNDSSADTLVAQAEALGLTPDQLRTFVYDFKWPLNYTGGGLEAWAWRNGFAHAPDGLKRAVPPEIPEEEQTR
jgi:hypothetical protein